MIDVVILQQGLVVSFGLTMHSERPEHRMYEQWHPLGIMSIITFNFPVRYGLECMIAAVCGNVMVWKGSEKTPLCGVAIKNCGQSVKENNLPEGIFNLVTGDHELGEWMTIDARIPLISATGSIRMGKEVAKVVGGRLGKSILELGGNNAIIISKDADLEMAIRATVFGAVGTCGQRCTSTRRIIVHEDIYYKVKDRLVSIYQRITIGDPLEPGTLWVMIDQAAVDTMQEALEKAKGEGGTLVYGGQVIEGEGNYVYRLSLKLKMTTKLYRKKHLRLFYTS